METKTLEHMIWSFVGLFFLSQDDEDWHPKW